jgi:hypothetical protein
MPLKYCSLMGLYTCSDRQVRQEVMHNKHVCYAGVRLGRVMLGQVRLGRVRYP